MPDHSMSRSTGRTFAIALVAAVVLLASQTTSAGAPAAAPRRGVSYRSGAARLSALDLALVVRRQVRARISRYAPPGPVTGFTASAGHENVTLRWTNPSSAAFALTRILARTDTYPANSRDASARLVYSGRASSHVDAGLTNGTTYFYAAFAYNQNSPPSAAALASATPDDTRAPVITVPPSNATAQLYQAKNVLATVTDDNLILRATLFYQVAGAHAFITASMANTSGSQYRATIPSSSIEAMTIQYYIEAEDMAGHVALSPAEAPATTHLITPHIPPRSQVDSLCLSCHGPGGPSGAHVDFSVALTPEGRVDRSACVNCHFLSHFGWGGVSTAYGKFLATGSPLADARSAHLAHSVNRGDAMGCAFGCHNVADCRACHTGVNHGPHGGLTEPYLRVNSAGETGTALVPCANSACHGPLPDVVGEGWSLGQQSRQWSSSDDTGRPECLGCHTQALSHRGGHAIPTAGADLCGNCHQIDLIGEHVDRRALACAVCHDSATAAVRDAIAAGRAGALVSCRDCHVSFGATGFHDFRVQAADGNGTANQGACVNCHFLSHFGWGGVSTAYGRFLGTDSPWQDPVRVHLAHSVNRGDAMGCGEGCHNVADCRSCHDQVPHGQHSGATQPYIRVNTGDYMPGGTGLVLVPCANSACHGQLPNVRGDGAVDPSTGLWDNGASEVGRPDCATCHPWTNAGFGL